MLSPNQQHVIPTIVFVLVFFPTVLVAISWRRLMRLPDADGRARALGLAVLLLATLSQAYLVLGLLNRDILGSDYGFQRFATIFTNLGVMLATTIVAAVIRREMGGVLVAACAWITGSWVYAAAVSSMV